jgi:hypothetical protein
MGSKVSSPSTLPSNQRGHQLLPRRDSHPIVITYRNLDTLIDLTLQDSCKTDPK